MKRIMFIIGLFFTAVVFSQSFYKEDFKIKSMLNFEETVNLLKENLRQGNISVFSEINHAEAAQKVGKDLSPTTVLIVGNPNIGTVLMQENQQIAIILPVKILIYEKDGQVWIAYKELKVLSVDYQIEKNKDVLEKIDNVIKNTILKSVSLQL